jgi:C-terminal processing protease CtpA/Prc
LNLIARLSIVLMMMILISCSGGGGSGEDDANAQCSQNWQNGYVYDLLQDTYLWYNQVAEGVDHTNFTSPAALLESVRPAIDRWSYITSKDNYYNYSEEGKFYGMGCSVEFDLNKNLWVRFVYDGSPADEAGIARSDEILSINGRSSSLFADLEAVWDEIYRYESAEVEFRTQSGWTQTRTLASDWVTINAVLHRDLIEIDDVKIGYLVFKTFIEPAEAELDAAFAYFKRQGVDELILDLRYNGGGRISIALHLASLIAGENTNDEVFCKTHHNDKYSRYDAADLFSLPTYALGLDRVFVISTSSTCSASELIINGLSPFMEVVQVGGSTCGKPVGMYAHDFCDSVILPIEFKSANAQDETDYFDGLAPTCAAEDDLTRQFGDQEEEALKTALYYIANGACPDPMDTVRSLQAEGPLPINELTGFRREIGAF